MTNTVDPSSMPMRNVSARSAPPASQYRSTRVPTSQRFLGILLTVLGLASVLSIQDAFRNTTLWWTVDGIVLITLLNLALRAGIWSHQMQVVGVYLLMNLVYCIWGAIEAEDYWEWKALVDHLMGFLIPLIAYLAVDPLKLLRLFRGYVRLAIPLSPFVFILIPTDFYGFYLAALPLLLLGLPMLGFRVRVLLLSLALFVVLIDVGARSNVIRTIVPIGFLCLEIFPRRWKVLLMRISSVWLFLLPAVLLSLALSGGFNVFQTGETLPATGDSSSDADTAHSVKADTRTFLYEEVFSTLARNDAWVFGRSPAKGSETTVFADIADITGKEERPTSEVGALNLLTWTGVVGLVAYAATCWIAAWRGLYRSQNDFCRYVALFVSFRWAFAWIEDPNTFTLNYAMVWVLIGICLSPTFRAMSNSEVRAWFRAVFSKRRGRSSPATLPSHGG